MTQQEEDHLSHQPTSGTKGYSIVIIDRIVHEKIQEFTNKMGPFYQSPSVEESGILKTVITTSPQQQVLMKSLWKALNKSSLKNQYKN